MTAFARMMRSFRQRRMGRFADLFKINQETRILDVGGTAMNWKLLPVRPRVTLLNMPLGQDRQPDEFTRVAASGCDLPFAAGSFDIVFSNSVIEHVGDRANQKRFAEEVRRVGRRYWVQTPNRGFFVDAHLLTPFLHFLPHSWQRAIAPRFTVWEWIERPSPDRHEFYIRHYLDDIRLLSAADLRGLFPDAIILRERWLGMTKSLIAYRA